MSNRLDEIEARAKAAAAEPRCTDCGREVILHDMLCGECGVDAICRDAGDDVPPRERSLTARVVDDTTWLIAQVRERDAEIARLRALLSRASRDHGRTQRLLVKASACSSRPGHGRRWSGSARTGCATR